MEGQANSVSHDAQLPPPSAPAAPNANPCPSPNLNPPRSPSPSPNPNTNSSSRPIAGAVGMVSDVSPAHQPGCPPLVSQQYMVMIQNASGIVPDFNVRGAYVTAHLQVFCGIMSVVLGVVAILIESEDAYIGAPIWTGIFFFMSAGLTGEFAAKRRQNCLITGYLVLSILSAVAAFQLLSLMASFTAWEFGTFYSSSLFRGRVAVDALTAVIALLELGISIVASVISCRGTCCQTSTGSSMTVQYMPAVPGGGTTIQDEHGNFIQAQPIQLTTCTPGQVAYQLPAYQVTQPLPPPSPQPHQPAAYPPPYPSQTEDAVSRVEDNDDNDQMAGMEKVPLV